MAEIGIIVPVYNAEKYLSETIESLLTQTFSDFRIYFINDGSKDRSEQIIRSYQAKDSRIEYIKKSENSGVTDTLNLGLKHCKEPFIARMDADDIAIPTRLERQIEYLKAHPEIDVLGTNMELFGNLPNQRVNLPEDHARILMNLLFRNVMAHPTIMFRKNLLDTKGFVYSNSFPHMEDYYLWYSKRLIYRYHNMQEVLLRYRMEGQNITVQNKATHVARLAKFHQMVLADLDMSYDDDIIALHGIRFGGDVPVNKSSIKKLHQHLSLLKKAIVKKAYIEDNKIIDEILKVEWRSAFFEIVDKGNTRNALYYWYLSEGPKWSEIKYFVGGKLRQLRLRGG